MRKTLLLPNLLLAASLLRVHAADYTETGTSYNSHNLPASGETVSYNPAAFTSLDHIFGTLAIATGTGLSENGDVYKIYISNPAAFSASTVSLAGGRNGFDTQLFLFNLNGTGIATNDDKSPGAQSLLPAGNALYSSLSAGYYYLVITGGGSYTADASNTRIFPNAPEGGDPTQVYGPKSGTPDERNAVWTGYSGTSTEGGTYSISLTGAAIAAVPEPSSIGLFLTGGLCALGFIRRQKRQQKNLASA